MLESSLRNDSELILSDWVSDGKSENINRHACFIVGIILQAQHDFFFLFLSRGVGIGLGVQNRFVGIKT